MVANIIYSYMLNATWVKCHLVAFNPGGNYQGNRLYAPYPCFNFCVDKVGASHVRGLVQSVPRPCMEP